MFSKLSDWSQTIRRNWKYKIWLSKHNPLCTTGVYIRPTFYLIYVNHISGSANDHILSFADDTSLYLSDSNPNDLFNQANSNFADSFDWFCINCLSLNPTNTKYIVFRRKSDFSGKVVSIYQTSLYKIAAKFNDKTTIFLDIYNFEASLISY